MLKRTVRKEEEEAKVGGLEAPKLMKRSSKTPADIRLANDFKELDLPSHVAV